MAPGSRLQELTAQYMQNPRRYFVPLANAYRQAGDLDRAIGICREHLPEQPGHMSGHIVLGRAYFGKGDLDAAREVFMTSIALDDENVIALRHLGDIARARGATVEARQWFARLLQSDPHDRDVAALVRALDAEGAAQRQDIDGPARTDGPKPVVEPQLSALADPTPPGLRAIVGERKASPLVERHDAAVVDAAPPAALRPLETFDLSTLDDVDGRETSPLPSVDRSDELAVAGAAGTLPTDADQSGLIGFGSDDLDSLIPGHSETPSAPSVSVASVDEAAPHVRLRPPVATPLDNSAIDGTSLSDDQPDEVLARPGFGALASFASWRSQQERNTPLYTAPLVPESAVESAPAGMEDVDDDIEAFWSGSAEATVTAPEFVTETMAALYAQQGFTQQALDVYRQLLWRSPESESLQTRVTELEARLAESPVPASLEDDADNALQFNDFAAPASPDAAMALTLDGLFGDVSEPVPHDVLSADFDSGWADPQSAASEQDDWFEGEEQVDPIIAADDGAYAGMFGIEEADPAAATSAAGIAVRRATPENLEVATVGAATLGVLEAVFGTPVIATADAAAGDILARLAVQMVGRLPKEAPTLPTPEVLELPTPLPAAATRSGSPAPLLSFDRFFSGSGSPPRARVDTPRAATAPPRAPGAAAPAPSLSPTFGGVPVVPTTDVAPAPTWPGFDQFLPERRRQTPGAPNPSAPGPSTPGSRSGPTDALPAPRPSGTVQEKSGAEASEAASHDTPRPAPSDFHRWLEGLS